MPSSCSDPWFPPLDKSQLPPPTENSQTAPSYTVMEIKKEEFAEDFSTLGSVLFKPCFALCYYSLLELSQTQGKKRCAANSWVMNFQTMLKGAELSIFFLVFYWQQIFVFGIFLWKAENGAVCWLGAAHGITLQWGIWKTLRPCGTCLTDHGSHCQLKIYGMITDSGFCGGFWSAIC